MKMETNQKQSGSSHVLPIIIMFALFFMIAFVTGYQNPLGNVIKSMSGDNAIMSQLGNFANFIAYAVMGYPAGVILNKYGYRITSLSAVTVGFVGVLITFLSGLSNAVAIYLVGAFVSGFSMCMLNTVVNPMLNSLGKNENQGNQLIQFGGSCNSLGATLAPVVVGYLIGGQASSISSANPVFFMAMAIFFIAFLVIFFSKLPESPTLGKKAEQINKFGAFKFRHFVLGILAIFMYVGIEVGIANMSMQYISQNDLGGLGLGAGIAGAIVGMYWLLMLVGRLLGGAVGSKISSRAMLTFVSAVAMVLVLLAIYMPSSIVVSAPGFENAGGFHFTTQPVPVSVLLLILCGLCTSVMWGAIFNLAVSGLGKYTQVASGLFMVMVCGGGILPLIQASIAKGSSYLTSFWLIFALLAYLLFYALVGSRAKGETAE